MEGRFSMTLSEEDWRTVQAALWSGMMQTDNSEYRERFDRAFRKVNLMFNVRYAMKQCLKTGENHE